MDIREHEPLKGKTTMRIGGTARYFAQLATKADVEEAVAFAKKQNVPLIPLGGGSNTIFADGEIDALVVRIKASDVLIHDDTVTVNAGKILPALINELAEEGLDISPLTGILGTVGGAVFGNAGQGPTGTWIDAYIESVDAYIDGTWKTLSKEECNFRYRESWFKAQPITDNRQPPIIWSATLKLPKKDSEEIKEEIQRLLQKRIETQPHVKTAGSCFKAVGDTPAWKLIDAAELRNTNVGNVHISEKHANFLINDGDATFDDAKSVVDTIQKGIPEGLEVEMRFVNEDGTLEY